MSNKPRSKTKLVSVRIDETTLNEFKSRNLNLSFAINALLRGYLYIQKYDEDCPSFGSSALSYDSINIDCYFKDSINYD